jgi:hypothetical protein
VPCPVDHDNARAWHFVEELGACRRIKLIARAENDEERRHGIKRCKALRRPFFDDIGEAAIVGFVEDRLGELPEIGDENVRHRKARRESLGQRPSQHGVGPQTP